MERWNNGKMPGSEQRKSPAGEGLLRGKRRLIWQPHKRAVVRDTYKSKPIKLEGLDWFVAGG